MFSGLDSVAVFQFTISSLRHVALLLLGFASNSGGKQADITVNIQR